MSSPPAVRIPVKKVWVLPPDEFGHRYVMALFKDRGETMVAQLGIVGQLGGDTALADYEAGRPVYIRRRGGQKQDWSPGAELGGASAPPSRKRGVIRAYHQVGTDAVPGDDRALLLDRILEEGFVSPATERVKRAEMEEECFGDAYVEPLDIRFQHASREGLRALREMARDVIGRLPEEGTTHTLFNCVDLLAGDLGRIFLSLGNWYQGIPNGLVYDARDLLMRGARFRYEDFLRDFGEAAEDAAGIEYDSLEEARQAVERALDHVIEEQSRSGKEGAGDLESFVSASHGQVGHSEIVWDGRLPTDLALEVWMEGKKLGRRERRRQGR